MIKANVSVNTIKAKIVLNQQLVEELRQTIIRKTHKVQPFLKNNIWGEDQANMQLINKYNKKMFFIMCY